MANITALQPVKVQSAESTRSEPFTVNGQKYMIIRFSEDMKRNLAQTIAIAKGMERKRMLTLKEAREIIGDSESNAAFRNALRPGEWSYVRDPESEAPSCAACLGHNGVLRELYAVNYYGSDFASPVVILKVTGRVAAAQSGAATKLLRRGRQQLAALNTLGMPSNGLMGRH
jgi:hypothetical protein